MKQILAILQKTQRGSVKAGHKYKERHKNKHGDWEYVYQDPQIGAISQHGFDFDAPRVAMVAPDPEPTPARESTAQPDAAADAYLDKLWADGQFDPRGYFALNLNGGNGEYLATRFGAAPEHMVTKARGGFTMRGETDRYVWQYSYRGVFSAWKKQTPMPYDAKDSLRAQMTSARDSYRADIDGGSYDLIARGRTDNGDLTPADFNPAFEARHVEAVMNSMRALMQSDEGKALARAIDSDGDLLAGGRQRAPHYMIICTDTNEDAGMGSAGIGSGGKVFWQPYTNQRGAPPLIFGLDPVYVLIHELHHSYGSGSEFDTFSSCLAIDYHLRDGNTLNPAGVKEELGRMLHTGFVRDRKFSYLVARERAAVKWLMKRYPYQMAGLMKEILGAEYATIATKVKRW